MGEYDHSDRKPHGEKEDDAAALKSIQSSLGQPSEKQVVENKPNTKSNTDILTVKPKPIFKYLAG